MSNRQATIITLPAKRMFWLNVAFWLVLWLFSVWNNYQWVTSVGNTFSWEIVFSWSFPYYLVMILLGPVAFWFYQKWQHRPYRQQWLFHLFPALLVGSIHQLTIIGFHTWFNPDPSKGTFWELLLERYTRGFAFSTNGFLFYWLCLGLIFSFALYYNYRQQERSNLELKAALSQSQLQSLQRQLQPHFLFNTFNSIAMMARQEKHKEVVQMIAHLSDLLRATLALPEDQSVSMEKELTLVRNYLQIEEMRFRDRLTVAFNISEQALSIQVPSLFLQPIVENAFQHGISKTVTNAYFSLDIFIKESRLWIVVDNSGPMVAKDWILEEHLGIGLASIKKRLNHLFPNNHSLTLKNLRDQTGVSVTINLPIE